MVVQFMPQGTVKSNVATPKQLEEPSTGHDSNRGREVNRDQWETWLKTSLSSEVTVCVPKDVPPDVQHQSFTLGVGGTDFPK